LLRKLRKNLGIYFFLLHPVDLWFSTASRLQGLTIIKQRIYQITFRNIYAFKKWLVKSGLVWSRTLSILLSTNAESVSMPVS